MTSYPWSGRFPATLPGVTARGRRAGTTDDQRFVIVFGVIVLMSVLIRVTRALLMASSVARAVLPCLLETEVI
jgi:hypothetical protein